MQTLTEKTIIAARAKFGARYHDKVTRASSVDDHENWLNTNGDRGEMEAMAKSGYLFKPAGSSRYYIRLDNMLPKPRSRPFTPATHRPFAHLGELLA